MRVGATLPSACAVGEQFYKSTATAGQNLYGCTTANVWTAQGGSGSGSVGIYACASTSGSDAYACTTSPAFLVYLNVCLLLTGDAISQGTATVNANTLGAKNILGTSGGALADGDIPANVPKLMCYDGTSFILQGGGGGGIGGGGGGGGAGLSIGTVDTYLDMNTSTPGTLIDATIMQNGTIGYGNITGYNLASMGTAFTVGAHAANRALGGSVIINEVSYPTSHASQALCFDNNQAFTTMYAGFSGGFTSMVVAGWITLGPAKAIPNFSASLFDYVGIFAATGSYAMLQLNNGNGPGSTYAIAIETKLGAGIDHSGYITVVPGNTYYATMIMDLPSGVSRLSLYNPSFVQVGSTVTVTGDTGSTIQRLLFGNNEVGTSNSQTCFENWLFSYTNPIFPLGPTAQ